jgi:hypothetical protein
MADVAEVKALHVETPTREYRFTSTVISDMLDEGARIYCGPHFGNEKRARSAILSDYTARVCAVARPADGEWTRRRVRMYFNNHAVRVVPAPSPVDELVVDVHVVAPVSYAELDDCGFEFWPQPDDGPHDDWDQLWE